MLTELTLLSTIAVHHLLIGAGLFSALFILIKVFKVGSEMQSWLWLTALFIATLFPLSSVVNDSQTRLTSTPIVRLSDINTQTRSVNDVIEIRDVIKIPNNDTSTPEWNLPSEFIFSMSTLILSCLILWFTGSTWRLIQKLRAYGYTRRVFS